MGTTVGFIGLGVMGKPMAARLSSTYRVVGFDLDQSRFEGLDGVEQGATVTDVVERSETILLSLPATKAVESVIAGDGGILESARSGQVVIDLSTTEPETTKRLAQLLEGRGVEMMDAPVSGGQKGAEEGTLSIMCGGTQELFEASEPILRQMGGSVIRVGEIGSGEVAKLANNMIVAAAFSSITEALALSSHAGIDPRKLHEAIRGGWAGSPVLDVAIEAVASGDYRPGGTVDLLSKDIGYARNLARSAHIPIPVTAIVDEVFTAAVARGDGGKAQPVIIELWEQLLGTQIGGSDSSGAR